MFTRHKKLIISIALVVVLFVGGLLGFVIIPNAMNQFKAAASGPSADARQTVSGNGGNAVMVGDYLYFINGFVSSASVSYKQNEHNKVKNEGAIYRIKMPKGFPEYDNSYLNDYEDWENYSQYDRNHPLQNPEYKDAMDKVLHKDMGLRLIVPKIAGWEKSALYVFDNTLIYTSPNNQKDKHGQLQRDRTDFFRVNLKGGNHQKIYTTRTTGVTNDDFTTVHVDGKTYLLVRDGDRLVRVGMNGKSSTISSKAESSVFPIVTSYYKNHTDNLVNSFSGMMEYVFYTEKCETENCAQGENLFMRYHIATGKKDQLRHDNNTHTMLALGNGALMFETTLQDQDHKNMYAIDDVAASFDLSHLNSHYKTNMPLQPEERLFLSGERASSFSYITQAGATLRVYDRSQGPTYINPREIADDVAEIIQVARANILYKTLGGTLKCIDYSGKMTQTQAPAPSTSSGRVTAFRVLNEAGEAREGYMFFYIKTMHCLDDDHDHSHNHDHLTVGFVVDLMGNEHILARLDEKFINLPEKD